MIIKILNKTSLIFFFLLCAGIVIGQQVPIVGYSINSFGQPELEIEASADKYYLLQVRHEPDRIYESITSMTLGSDGQMVITEPLAAFPRANYIVTEHSIDNPDDTDGDGIDDITEYNDRPTQSPLNFGGSLDPNDGTTCLPDLSNYEDLATISDDIPWSPFLNNRQFAKFVVINQDTDTPEIYFINSKTHEVHATFLLTLGLDSYDSNVLRGEIVYNPNDVLPNGAIGSFNFNYTFGEAKPFDITRRTYELLAANMPFLSNNMSHFIGGDSEFTFTSTYEAAFTGSRVPIVLESAYFSDVDFLPFNQAEGYGFFRVMQLDETPGSRDIVLYDALPNSLPRVGGIITSVVQTPLSHVNLRAIQDKVPNAYIKDPLLVDSIANLVGKYIYYKVDQDHYEIREADLEEVNEWFEKLRPTSAQIPERDLSQTDILPLDEIVFDMSVSFGAKCSNVATMRTFGFPEGTIPNGFGVPFYFYDEFMKFNGFYDQVEEMISDPNFSSDFEERIERLDDFRKEIRKADMPQWMLDALQEMHESFPEGTSIRCRSSTNNEDLPGFSGAGLYTSKTQHPDEGHISKSIKQVYASMWNFRAYEEREFYRVDQYIAAMGVLCHPNYQEEKSNGVGVSLDPIYQTEGNFYLNTQVGEFLITNPDADAIPEEILLAEDPYNGYFVLRNSNLAPTGELIMNDDYLDQLRSYLRVIHDEFEILYDVAGAEGFGMDIEYKVTRDDQLIVKQARPWVSFWADIKSDFDLATIAITEPVSSANLGTSETVTATIKNTGLNEMKDFELSLLVNNIEVEKLVIEQEMRPQFSQDFQFSAQDFSDKGKYQVAVVVSHPLDGFSRNDTLHYELNSLHEYEAGLLSVSAETGCSQDMLLTTKLANLGGETIASAEIEVTVNGQVTNTVTVSEIIPSGNSKNIEILVLNNLNQTNNEIKLRLLSINGVPDPVDSNNEISLSQGLETSNNWIRLNIDVDEYPQENSWRLINLDNNRIIGEGQFDLFDFTVDLCVNYSSCHRLTIFDSAADGICCEYGIGSLEVEASNGEVIVEHDGRFETVLEIVFCPENLECLLAAEIETTDISNQTAADGMIVINPSAGIAPYEYSIDGGNNFITNNSFNALAAGTYNVVVRDVRGDCLYEETVIVKAPTSTLDLEERSIRVFPNPTTGSVFIHTTTTESSEIQVEIFDSMGSLVDRMTIKAKNNSEDFEIPMSKLPQGTYFLKCSNRNIDENFRLVKI